MRANAGGKCASAVVPFHLFVIGFCTGAGHPGVFRSGPGDASNHLIQSIYFVSATESFDPGMKTGSAGGWL